LKIKKIKTRENVYLNWRCEKWWKCENVWTTWAKELQ